MQAGVGDSSYPVMAGIKWTKTYDAVLATPVGVRDLTLGHIGWVGLRLLLVTTVYMAALLAFDAVEVGSGLLAIAPSMMTGFAFSGLVMAYTAHLEDETGLSSLFRFGVVPLFLFSGTFFPVSQLPDWMEPLALLTPLWHGVELARAAAGIPGSPHLPWYIHLGFLAAFATVGVGLAVRQMRRRLVK
jgi:lipooligosaccharide transport system permease protein